MALDDVLRHIDREAEAEVTRIETAGHEEVQRLLRCARTEADTARGDRLRAEAAAVDAQARALLHDAMAAADRTRRLAEEEVFQDALKRARWRLARLRESPEYAGLLRSLLAEALAALPEADTVAVDPRDLDLVSPMLPDTARNGQSVRVRAMLTTWGGVEVSARDGRVLARNTLESRLLAAAPYLRAAIAAEVNRC